MEHHDVKAFLNSLRINSKAKAMISQIPEPKNTDEWAAAYAKIAGELGFEVTEDDLKEFVAIKEKKLQEQANASAAEIEELSADELGEVAGGGDHSDCKDTYKDKENCWVNDGCDIINNHYSDYQCHYNNKCAKQNFTCGKDWYDKCGSYYYYGG